MKRLFLQKAHRHIEGKHAVVGQYLSEKFDGCRAWYDGGISRGMLCSEVPYANTTKDTKPHIATGLWSMNAKAIFAPDWWLDKLPAFPVDGELWCGHGKHQQTKSAVSTHTPIDERWRTVQYMLFDSPNLGDILYDGNINTTTHKATFCWIEDWLKARDIPWEHKWLALDGDYSFANTLEFMQINLSQNEIITVVYQQLIQSEAQVQAKLREVLALGGEGIILRSPDAHYSPSRVHTCTKWKPYIDDEAIVTGRIKTGRQTALGSKLLGLMGALEVCWKGKYFWLSGFTDLERELIDTKELLVSLQAAKYSARTWACNNPDTLSLHNIKPLLFSQGDKIVFKYRELTVAGIPKEASYLRQRSDLEG